MTSFFSNLYNWFYQPQSARVIGLYRILIGIVTLLTVLLFGGHLKEMFSDSGYVTNAIVRSMSNPNTGPFSLLYLNGSLAYVQFLYAILIISCILFIFGLWSRVCGILLYALYLSFFNRFPLMAFDGSQVLLIALFFTMFLNTDQAYVPRWYAQRFKKNQKTVPGWPVRMIQMQLAMVYFFAAIAKLRAQGWYSGTEMLGSLNYQYAIFNFSWLTHHPLLVNIFTYGTIVVELSFIFLVWNKRFRRLIILAMLGLHLGIFFTLQVMYFSEVMIAVLALFLLEDDLDLLKAGAQQVYQKARTWLKKLKTARRQARLGYLAIVGVLFLGILGIGIYLSTSSKVTAEGCPQNFIKVPGTAKYTTTDFCIMKYEAKLVMDKHCPSGFCPASQPQGRPWAFVPVTEAVNACIDLGPGYHLTTENEWMTVADNIATTPINDLDAAPGPQFAVGNANNSGRLAG